MIDLPSAFSERMKADLGERYESFIKSYDTPPVKGVRANLLKISAEEFKNLSPVPLEGGVPWEKSGFYASGEGLGKTVFHAAGLYYVQEPSAMFPAAQLEAKSGERVLDLCSAPGGKGTQLAADMQGGGVLVLNEINRKRADILRSNVERLGVKNAVVTCADPKDLAEVFEGYFDKILVDAPCSGEGMFKKEENAIPEWSLQNVLTCATRQAEILTSADKMLKGGGLLVYSTCTFSPEEDEEQVQNFLNRFPEYTLLSQTKLMPHEIRGEGQFCAVLQKGGNERRDLPLLPCKIKDDAAKPFLEWQSKTLKIKLKNILQSGDSLFLIPDGAPALPKNITSFTGVYLGKIEKGRFIPSHALAASLKSEEVNCVEVDQSFALSYLRGLTFPADEPDGWRAVTHKGFILGWCKISGGTAKNHYPKGIRI